MRVFHVARILVMILNQGGQAIVGAAAGHEGLGVWNFQHSGLRLLRAFEWPRYYPYRGRLIVGKESF